MTELDSRVDDSKAVGGKSELELAGDSSQSNASHRLFAEQMDSRITLAQASDRVGEVNPDLEKMSDADLHNRIFELSMSPNLLKYKDEATGQVKEMEIPLDAAWDKITVNGKRLSDIDIMKNPDYELTLGGFDKAKTIKNLKEYKQLNEEAIKRADRLYGNKPEALLGSIRGQMKVLEAGLLEPSKAAAAHIDIISKLNVLSDPVSYRMEYAMRLETLGERRDASSQYKEAFEKLKDLPGELIEEEKLRLSTDKSRTGAQPLNIEGYGLLDSNQTFTALESQLTGLTDGGRVLDAQKGVYGRSHFLDPVNILSESTLKDRNNFARSARLLYGLDDLGTVLAKRSAFFHLAPVFVQKMSHGDPLVVDKNDAEVSEVGMAKHARVPAGEWTYGNTSALKPDQSKEALAHVISDYDRLSVEEAKKLIEEDQKQAVKDIAYLKSSALVQDTEYSMRDPEINMLYRATLNNVDPVLTAELRDKLSENVVGDFLAATAAGITFTILSRGKVKAPLTTRQALGRAAGNLTMAGVAAGSTRYGYLEAMYGRGGTLEENAVHALGMTLVGIGASKIIAKRATGNSVRMIPEANAERIAAQLRSVPGGAPVVDFVSGFKNALNLEESALNLKHNVGAIADNTLGTAGEAGTLGQLRSLLAGEAGLLKHFQKPVELSSREWMLPATSDAGSKILKEAGVTGSKFGLSDEAFSALKKNPTILDIDRALTKQGNTKLTDFRRMAELSADDLLRPLDDPLSVEILKRAGIHDAGLRGVAQKIFNEAARGKLTNIEKLVEYVGAHASLSGKELTVGKFKDFYRRFHPNVDDIKYDDIFETQFPNLAKVPVNTALDDVFRYSLRAFDGSGLKVMLKSMDKATARSIRAVKGSGDGVMSEVSYVLRSTGKTAWDTAGTAVRSAINPGERIVKPVVEAAKAARDPVARTEFLKGLPSSAVPNPVVDAFRYGWDRVKIPRLNTTSDLKEIARSDFANGLHGYAYMNGAYGSTIGAYNLMQENGDLSYYDAFKQSAIPPMNAGTFIDYALMASFLKTGSILSHKPGLFSYFNLGKSAFNGSGLFSEAIRPGVMTGAYIGADWAMQKGWKYLENASNRKDLFNLDNFSSQIGPDQTEKLKTMKEPITNDSENERTHQ